MVIFLVFLPSAGMFLFYAFFFFFPGYVYVKGILVGIVFWCTILMLWCRVVMCVYIVIYHPL